jgi:hypothetical protein
MQNDDDLRARFRSLAKEDAERAPGFSTTVHAANARVPRRRSLLRSIAQIGVAVAAVVVALVLGMAWGTNTGYASARVEGQRERSDLAASTLGAASQLAVARLDIARIRAEFERQAKAGGSSSAAIQSASERLRTIEAAVARIETDLARGESSRSTSQTIPAGDIPMKRALAMTCSALSIASSAVGGQRISITELPPATAKAPASFGSLLDVRDVGGGKILVNDGLRRRMVLMDSLLRVLGVPVDSAPGNANSYGPRAVPVVRYVGDSLLTSDMNARTMLVMSPAGQVVRAIAEPVEDFPILLPSRGTGVDSKGRMVFQGFKKPDFDATRAMSVDQRVHQKQDSVPILRADLETRRIDTLALVMTGGTTKLMGRATENGPIRYSAFPIENVDNWALLSDGSIAIVRGQDYHIDWIDPDGKKHSTTKLPFDWKRLTDEDKQKLIDSTREASSAAMSKAFGAAAARQQPDVPQQPGARRFVPTDPNAPVQRAPVEYLAPDLKDLPDYYPPIRLNSVMPDLDGNLWILPTSSAQSKQGELVYDVVNAKGGFHRVRMPVGKSIAGFGKGGVLFLQSGDRTNGFYLERIKLPPFANAAAR